MKTLTKIGILALGLQIMVGGAYAAGEMGAELPAAKTLADFQKDYAATKPIVAVQKFWEYEALKATPKPTLAVSQMRTDEGRANIATKPVLGMEK